MKALVRIVLVALAGATWAAGPAQSATLYDDDGWQVNLTTQLQYSGAVRVAPVNNTVIGVVNTNNGDQNFQHGLIANEFEVVPVLSATYGSFGFHASGEAYVNTPYLTKNQNETPNQLNYSVENGRDFPSGTQNIDGKYISLLDAFVYDSWAFGADDSQSVTVKVGRQTLLWGQSLFYTNDGIAGGQAPVDINNALTLANPQAQQVFLPVGQSVVTYHPNDWLTLQGYYQFEWRQSQLPGSGSYFWTGDFVAPGGDRLILADFGNVPYYLRRIGSDRPGSSNGQFGASIQAQLDDYDVGLFALRFDGKTPQVYITNVAPPPFATRASDGLVAGNYYLTYQRDVNVYGASVSTTVGPANVGGEISARTNQDLYSNAVIITPQDSRRYPGYAVGNLINAQISGIYLTPGLPLMPGGMSLAGEAVYNRVIAVTANSSTLVAGRTPGAASFTIVASPNYYNVLPNLDLSFPVGFSWNPYGRSQFDPALQAGTGSLNIGVIAQYETVWKAGINYKRFIGSPSVIPPGVPKQGLADRDYVSFFVSRTL